MTPHPYPTFKNIRGAGRGEATRSSPIWSTEGSGQSWVVHIPHRQLQVGGSLLTAPCCSPKPPAAHSCGLLGPSSAPFTGETTVVKWCLSPAPGETALPQPCSGLRQGAQQGLMAQRIHSCGKAGSWAFQLHTQAGPPNGSGGGSPSPGPEWKFCQPDDSQMRLAPQALSHSLSQPAGAGWLPGALRRPRAFVQLSPKQQSQGATRVRPPGPRHLCHSHSTRGPFTAGPAGGA